MQYRVQQDLPSIHQGILLKQLKQIFPNEETFQNTRKQSALKYPATNVFMEFDIWIPSLGLCFEFQDAYHYVTTWYYQNPQSRVKQRDNIKKSLAYKSGLYFIVIPCWWDGSSNSLESTIQFHRPDLLHQESNSPPISLNPPQNYFQTSDIPNVGELMLASFPNDLNFSREIEKDTWWMGEKYDGIRCCWNPIVSHFIFVDLVRFNRSGRVIDLSQHNFTFPNIFVDGELWFGRGKFSLTNLFNYSFDVDSSAWSSLRMICFDNASYEFRKDPFEDRYTTLISKISSTDPFNIIASRVGLGNTTQLVKSVESIIHGNGEGVILRKKGSLYEPGRNLNLIKLKSVLEDREAVVISKREDGSVELKLPENTSFVVPKQAVHVPNLAIGDVVSFFHEGSRSGVLGPTIRPNSETTTEQGNDKSRPKLGPMIYRIRTDLLWEDVVRNYENEIRFLNEKSKHPGFSSQLRHQWTAKNMRIYLEKFARKRNLDPFIPQTWYSISHSQLRKTKGGKAILRKFKGSFFDALQHLFPEIEFDKTNFRENMSHSIENRRQFFEKFAKENKFDPHNSDNWFNRSRKDIIAASQEGTAVMNKIKGGYYKGLKVVFPELNIDSFHQYSWREPSNRRKFFEQFAHNNNFNPMHADNWYSVSRESILAIKGGTRVLYYHGNSMSRALLDLFPEIGLVKSKFSILNTWGTEENRRNFFEKFAINNNFDYKVPENWYSLSRDKVLACKGGATVLSYHHHRVSQALFDLFPEIIFDNSKFLVPDSWRDVSKRREFFERYAKDNNFDPLIPDMWYFQNFSKLLSLKGARTVLSYHEGRIFQALSDLFPEVIFDLSKFNFNVSDEVKRKQFFLIYAHQNKFNPLIASNWYTHSIYNVLAQKGSDSVMQYYGYNLPKALLDIFPDIGLESDKLIPNFARDVFRIKSLKFFEKFANYHQFDPLLPFNWYSQSRDSIMNTKGATRVMSYYNKSISRALLDLFPNIGLVPDKLSHLGYWENPSNRRKLFENYARENNFDPLIPSNWYSQSLSNIFFMKGARQVIKYHENKIEKAIVDLFPEINFEFATDESM